MIKGLSPLRHFIQNNLANEQRSLTPSPSDSRLKNRPHWPLLASYSPGAKSEEGETFGMHSQFYRGSKFLDFKKARQQSVNQRKENERRVTNLKVHFTQDQPRVLTQNSSKEQEAFTVQPAFRTKAADLQALVRRLYRVERVRSEMRLGRQIFDRLFYSKNID